MLRTVTVTRGATATDTVDPAHIFKYVASVKTPAGVPYPASPTSGYTPVNIANAFSLTWAGASQPALGAQYVVVFDDGATGFQMRGSDFVKSAFTAGLRAAFSAQDFYPIFKYDADDTVSKLSIYESFPKRVYKNPALIVSTGAGKVSRMELDSEDLLTETRVTPDDPVNGMFAWGRIDIPVTINIIALSDRDRRKLTDLVALFCRHLFTNKFSSYGIGYRDINIGGEAEPEWQGQQLYTNTISIPCYTEYQVAYSVDLLDTINNINLEIDSDV